MSRHLFNAIVLTLSSFACLGCSTGATQYIPPELENVPVAQLTELEIQWCANWNECIWIDGVLLTSNMSGQVGWHPSTVFVNPGEHLLEMAIYHTHSLSYPIEAFANQADAQYLAECLNRIDRVHDITGRLHKSQQKIELTNTAKFIAVIGSTRNLPGRMLKITSSQGSLYVMEYSEADKQEAGPRTKERIIKFKDPYRLVGLSLWRIEDQRKYVFKENTRILVGDHYIGGIFCHEP